MTEKLSKHFTYDELKCKHCGDLKIEFALLEGLEHLRTIVDRPIIVNSAYRCPEHKDSKKNPNSYHIKGLAADIRVDMMPLTELYLAAEKVTAFRNGGIGIYPDDDFIHVDCRIGHARWARIDGEYVGIEAAL